jgi:hypothetical protein
MKKKAIATILFLMFLGWQFGLMRGTNAVHSVPMVASNLES